MLGDEVLTPDSSRFWPADGWQPGRAAAEPGQAGRPGLADLARQRLGPRLGDAPPPPLPPEVVERTAAGYREVYRRLTGADL